MADTSQLSKEIEPFVHDWLAREYGYRFERKSMPLVGCEGMHEFGGVSEDGKKVVVIRSSSGKTSGGNSPSAKIITIYKDLYFLSLVKADLKALVFTDEEFFGIVKKNLYGKIPKDIHLLYCQLSAELAILARSIRKKATDEIDEGKARS